jgi:hypothetical protein
MKGKTLLCLYRQSLYRFGKQNKYKAERKTFLLFSPVRTIHSFVLCVFFLKNNKRNNTPQTFSSFFLSEKVRKKTEAKFFCSEKKYSHKDKESKKTTEKGSCCWIEKLQRKNEKRRKIHI